ncbi:WG repeat-containing protein [Mangrovivirga sp. M17]|uniref:WG repeat-containing protein n=1 Tax=Mangrovivirga halotolerans TaxID=2993936 RepID=A0ABT3RPA8_9BACT|nr:WG repeat-containing protein [Mangrovivirga halotolerans]MCX2743645.1 WG repeat-containing protein [Mangrovivirga halotolerans]
MIILCSGCSVLEAQSKKEKKALKIWVKQEGKWGLINGMEEWIVDPQYANCLSVTDDLAIVTFLKDSTKAKGEIRLHAVVNNKGKEIFTFEAIEAKFTDNFNHIIYEAGTGTGVINTRGKILVKPVFEKLEEDPSNKNRFIAVKDRNYGLINSEGEVMISYEYDWLNVTFTNNYSFAKDEKIGLLSENGDIVLPNNYSLIMPTYKMGWDTGIELFNLLHAYRGDTIDYFVPGKDFFIEKNNMISTSIFIKDEGDKLIPYSDGEFTGYIDSKGERIIKLDSTFTHLSFFYEEVATVRKKLSENLPNFDYSKQGCGLINKDGQEIVPPIYTWIGVFSEGLVSCRLNGKYGAINKRGEVIIPFEYDRELNYASKQLAITRKGNNFGVINKKNESIIPFEFDRIVVFDKGSYFLCYTGNDFKIYNSVGMVVLTLQNSEVQPYTQIKTSYHQFY